MNQTRLLLVTPDFPPQQGGVARYLRLLADHFHQQITVVTSVSKSAQQPADYRIIECSLLSVFGWPKWGKSVALLFRMRKHYEIAMISHLLPFGTAAWIASMFTKKPYVIILHGMDVRLATRSWRKRVLSRIVLRHARVVVANSHALAQEVARGFGVTLPLVIYPCVEERTVLLETKAADAPFRILTVSRLVQRKGHLHVLMALSRLKQTGTIGPFIYDIVGEGPMRESLQSLAQELHLSEVRFHGELSDQQRDVFFSRADLFVMPVLHDPVDKEGFGLVYLEAAQYGIPSIGSKIEGVDEAILHEKTGILISSGNLDELTKAIATLAGDEQKRKQLGQQARERVQREFICQNQFSKLEPYL